MCLCKTKCQGVSQHFSGSAHLPDKVSRDMGYRNIVRYGAAKPLYENNSMKIMFW